MRTLCKILLVCGSASLGCSSSLPRRPAFFLPEDEPMTTERIEALIEPGMPIEEARRIMELYGFRCSYQNTVGIEYMHCEQERRKHLWPFSGVWSATIYHNGYVQRVQGRYELAIVDHGVRIPRKTGRVVPVTPPPGGPPMAPEPVIIEPTAKSKPSKVKR